MKLFIFILLTFSALNPVLVYSSCKEAFVPTASVQEKAQKSVWKVNSLDSSGTGFFIGPSIFVTNFHVVGKALKLNRIDDITLTQKGNPHALKVKAVKHLSAIYDLAVLEIEGDVSDSLDLKQGVPRLKDNLFLIGYPNGNFQVINKTGDIFSNSYNSEFDYIFPGNSSDSLGASGSPVLNADGEVVGVYYAGNENVLHAVKIIHLQNLLKQKVELFRSPKDHLEHSIKEAIEAAEQGYAPAQYNLALRYQYGSGVKQDYKKAFNLHKKAAEQGYALAQYNLGLLYQNGVGVKQNYQEAFKWYKKAAEQEHASAQNNLGSLYHLGHGVKQDYKKAFNLHKKAAEQGYALAQYNLAILYQHGVGVKQDFKKAFDLYKKSAEQGYAPAQFTLAVFYQNGVGVKQDFNKALKWYKKAAKQGYAPAQIVLSKLEAS